MWRSQCFYSNVEGCSVSQLCLTLCDSMDCSIPGFSILHHLPGFAQTHVHWVDAIQSYSLFPPLPPTFNLSQHQGFFYELAHCIRWPKYWSFRFSISLSNEYSGLTSLISLLSKELSRVFSSTTVQKHQFFSESFQIHHLSRKMNHQ